MNEVKERERWLKRDRDMVRRRENKVIDKILERGWVEREKLNILIGKGRVKFRTNRKERWDEGRP